MLVNTKLNTEYKLWPRYHQRSADRKVRPNTVSKIVKALLRKLSLDMQEQTSERKTPEATTVVMQMQY